jgi:hypothetical protein
MTQLETKFPRGSASNSAVFRGMKRFIREFNFPQPDWSSLPAGFPNCDLSGLTKEEKCLLDAIKMAWLTGTKQGKRQLRNRLAKSCSLTLITLITLISLISLILSSPQSHFAKPVNAATVSAALKQSVQINIGDLIESTMSAIRKIN